MATYTTLRYGSTGDEVKKLQQALGFTGKDVDGIYGTKTQQAVKNYQTNNGLSVDGIAGNQTLGKLYGGSTATPQQTPTYKYEEFKYAPYTKSDTVKQAEGMLQEHMANKPGEYTSNWQTQLNDTINKILNREEFSYDLNGDALYQQYKDQYTTQGKQAMMDAMGQAAAMTGGHGNSYAQSVGQQTYQGYLQQLNDKVPELYQIALNQYNQEEQSLYNQAALMAQQEEQEYGRYRDSVSDYYNDREYLTGRADKEAQTDYERWSDKVGMDYNIHSDKQTAGYQEKQDANTFAMSMLSLGVMPAADVLATAGISSADAQAIVSEVKTQKKNSTVSGSGGSGVHGGSDGTGSEKTGGSGYNNGGYNSDIVKQAQKFVGASTDGKWGSDSTAKAKAKGYNSIAEVVAAMGNNDGNPPLNKSDYEGWTALDWESYFAQIRQSEGKSAAETELNELTSQGIIPKKYLASAGIGARGSLGH